MLFAALFTTARICNQPKYPSTNEWIKNLCMHTHIYIGIYMYTHIYVYTHMRAHTMEYYSAITKNEILPFVTTWIDLEGIMLREISQKQLYTL